MGDSYLKRLHTGAIDSAPIIIAEAIGTGFYMFGGCIGTLSWDGEKPITFIPSFTFGLVAMIIIQCYIHLPNGHPYLNPAVTLAALIFRKTSFAVNDPFDKLIKRFAKYSFNTCVFWCRWQSLVHWHNSLVVYLGLDC